MNIRVITICLTLLASALADSRFAELAEEGGYAKQLATMIELHLQQNPDQFDGVLQLALQVRKQLEADMLANSQTYELKAGSFKEDLSVMELDLETQSTQLKATNKFLAEVSSELVSLISTANSLTKQLTMLYGKEEQIRENRGQELLLYNKRTLNANKMIGALRTILKTLSEAVLNPKQNAFSEVRANELIEHIKAELGPSDPLVALVELTKDFNRDVVVEIIHKLEFLEQDVEDMLKVDESSERRAIDDFNALLFEISDVRRRLTKDLSSVRNKIAKSNQEKVIAEKRRDQLDIDLPLSKQLLTTARNKREQMKATYQNSHIDREQQLKVANKAIEIIQGYIAKNRAAPTSKFVPKSNQDA